MCVYVFNMFHSRLHISANYFNLIQILTLYQPRYFLYPLHLPDLIFPDPAGRMCPLQYRKYVYGPVAGWFRWELVLQLCIHGNYNLHSHRSHV